MKKVSFIRRLFRLALLYGFVAYRQKQRAIRQAAAQPQEPIVPRFIDGYIDYLNSGKCVSLVETCPFKQVVSVQGFGYSGSGAVVDLLREYDGNLVIGFVDKEGSVTKNITASCYELDILRMAGGLFEFEKYLDSNNIFQNDALLHRFVLMVEKSDLYRELPGVRPYFYEFFSHVASILHGEAQWQCYNEHLNYEGTNRVIVLNKMSISNFRVLSRHLLYSIFTLYKGTSQSETLVIDQLFSDCEFNASRDLEYLPELKTICVYRDPRDVYVFAKKNNVDWLPHDVEKFIEWYKILFKNCNLRSDDNCLYVRFEDLVQSYQNEVNRIEMYLSIVPDKHVNIFSSFDPSKSASNIQIWRQNSIDKIEKLRIEQCLTELCYTALDKNTKINNSINLLG